MKKIIIFLIVLIMMFGLAGCSTKDKIKTKTVIDWCKEEVCRLNDCEYGDSGYIEYYEVQKLEENRNGRQFEEWYKITIYIADFINDKGFGVFRTRTYIAVIGYDLANFECAARLVDLDAVEIINEN
jgi:hypothetical protein